MYSMKRSWLVCSLLLFCPFPGISQPGGPIRLSPALITPDQPASLTQPNAATPPATSRNSQRPLVQLNNRAVILSRDSKNGPALSLLDRVQRADLTDTIAYNRALVLTRLKRYSEAATVLSGLTSFAHAQLNLGLLQCRAGQWESGLKSLLMAPATAEWADEKAINVALAHYHLEQYEAAANALNTAPPTPVTQILRGDLAMVQGKYDGALATYRSLATDENYGRVMPVRIGNALLGLRQFAEAANQFETYLKSGDRVAQPAARLGLANALYGQRDYGRAIVEYRAAVQLLPQSATARTGLANAFASNQDYRSARTHYETVLKQQSTNLNAALGMGVVAHRQGHSEESERYFDQIGTRLESTNPDHADAFLHQGLMALGRSRYDVARRALETATRLRSDDPSALLGLSEVFRRQDLYGQALETLQQAIGKSRERTPTQSLPQGDGPRKVRARMLANQGSLLLKLNLIGQAYPVFKEALKDDSRNLNALNGLAVSLLETDQLGKANALYDSILSRGNHKAFLHNNRGIVRAYTAMQLDKKDRPEQARPLYQQARTDFEKAQQLDTTRKFYQNNLGNALKNLEQYDEAVKCYQAYLSKSAINNMGVLYAANKKPDFSRYYLNLAIDLDSTNLVYQFNRLTLYRAFYADSLARKPKLLAAESRVPTTSISAKYSRDGYINIYLYDYDFDAYDYPADHHFPVQPEPPQALDLLPVNDFFLMPEPAELVPIAQPVTSRVTGVATPPTSESAPVSAAPKAAVSPTSTKRGRMPKPAKARRAGRWGSTRCPVF